MRSPVTFDMVPVMERGEVIYKQVNGLGTVATTAASINAASGVVANASALVPSKQVNYQSDFSKVSNTVATGAGVVAAVAVVIVPFGTIIAAVAGLIAVAAGVLGKVFANSKAKAYAAERREYENVNAQIKYENQELDNQYFIANDAINKLRATVKQLGLFGPDVNEGLGCLFNCKKNAEEAKLNDAKAQYDLLSKEQASKTQALASLLDEYNKLVKNILLLKEGKSTNNYIFWILGGSALLLGGYFAYQNRSKIKNEFSK